MSSYIEIKNISKNYISQKKINVLINLNYKFKKGKVYSLVGPSGSGKSTLLNILSLIDRPSKGNLFIDNKKIDFDNINENDKIRSNDFGIIYQEKNLLNDFNAKDNIILAGIANGKSLNESNKLSERIIKKLKLSNRSEHFPFQLSGGENQRIAIGRALINSPNIIIADEPSGNLDQKNAKEFFKLLLNLKSKNRIIIYATHNRYFANLADCRLKLINGKLKSINARI
jgi:ABC-type lipoprotein export system ATPase subunit|tara:strand:+ start:623 stop:1306 length:684 start_codon:yes stop_codon:yes gene_type:complete